MLDLAAARSASSALRRVRAGCEPVTSATGNAERPEPALEIPRVLLGEQFGRRHQRGLQSGADGARRGRGAATTVLPQPTSPCTSRTIGRSRARSRSTSASARRCAPVSANGSDSRKRARAPPHRASGQRGIALDRPAAAAAGDN